MQCCIHIAYSERKPENYDEVLRRDVNFMVEYDEHEITKHGAFFLSINRNILAFYGKNPEVVEEPEWFECSTDEDYEEFFKITSDKYNRIFVEVPHEIKYFEIMKVVDGYFITLNDVSLIAIDDTIYEEL